LIGVYFSLQTVCQLKHKMISSKLVKYIAQFKQQSIRGAERFNELTRGWVWMLMSAVKETLKPDTAITAAAIAYFSLFSIFPITLLSIAIASFSLGSSMDRQFIIQRLEFVAPAMGQLLGQNIDDIIEARGPVTGIALVGLVWSASTIFHTFTHALNQIWGLKQRRAFWKRRGVAILFVLIFVGPTLFLASFAGSMFSHLRPFLPDSVMSLEGQGSTVLAILLDIALFMTLYMLLPHGFSTWREVLVGAVWAGVLWELAKNTFLFFISTYISVSNMVYGSVTAIIAFLAWAYLSGLIFLFGAYLSVAYVEFKKSAAESTDKM
jgi:membrane protein